MLHYQANPWIGHLEVLYHIVYYLKIHMNMGRIGYDPMGPNVDLSVFNNNAYWVEFFRDVEEELPPNMPEPRGRTVSIYSFVGANHAGNVVTRRSHAGIIIFIWNTPIIWFSKKQNTFEAAIFGRDLVALCICKDFDGI